MTESSDMIDYTEYIEYTPNASFNYTSYALIIRYKNSINMTTYMIFDLNNNTVAFTVDPTMDLVDSLDYPNIIVDLDNISASLQQCTNQQSMTTLIEILYVSMEIMNMFFTDNIAINKFLAKLSSTIGVF